MRARLAFLTRHEALSAHVAPAGSAWWATRVPRTILPGGRGPRRVAPVRRAGRSPSLQLHHQTVAPEPTIKPTSDARQYRIVTRGECGRLLASLTTFRS